MQQLPITAQLVTEIANDTGAHPRTIVRRIAGLNVAGAAGRAIDRALEARGVVPAHVAGAELAAVTFAPRQRA